MEKRQEMEWSEAQKIVISQDLVAAAKKQLEFLAAVDRQRWLYDGPLLDYAIFRYKAFWLPLLAKHTEDGAAEGSLYVPLDCEWIWHCHRLNPVQYNNDCQKVFGRILNNHNVKSSLDGESKPEMAKLWAKQYPEEPFELKFDTICKKSINMSMKANITYDLVSAVKRQSSFFYQVSRPWMHNDRILEEAVARYKGFLYLIKMNLERSLRRFSVPTYDIDLIWHSHQLHPASYCDDTVQLLGKILEHDDTDSDRTKGKKLDKGFTGTISQWEHSFGRPYWRAGAMYRGTLPSPLEVTTNISNSKAAEESKQHKHLDLALPQLMVVEALLEVTKIKNLPDTEKGNLYVSISKNLPDAFFSGACNLNILPKSGKTHAAGFKCEPTGELILSLMSKTDSGSTPAQTVGTTSISLKELMSPDSKLSMQRWFQLKANNAPLESKAVSIYVAASFTVPVPAPCILRMVKSHPISANTGIHPVAVNAQLIGGWTHFLDQNGREIISLKMREIKKSEKVDKLNPKLEVVAMTKESKEVNLVAEYAENNWKLVGSNVSFTVKKERNVDGSIFNIQGFYQVKLLVGKRLEYEQKTCKQPNDSNFITAVEFSAEHPYGKALALFNMKDGLIAVNEDWFVLPGVTLAFILKMVITKDEYDALINTFVPKENQVQDTSSPNVAFSSCGSGCSGACGVNLTLSGGGAIVKGGGCGSGCGGGCGGGMMIINNSAAGCGSGCGSGCGGCGSMMMMQNNVAASGCGSGCNGGCGGCGSMMKNENSAGGCGSGCGGGCGNGLMRNEAAAAGCGGCGSGCDAYCSDNPPLACDSNGGAETAPLTTASETILVSA